MKLKTRKTEIEHIETDIELPCYFYFQTEMCDDIAIMVSEKFMITIEENYYGFEIKQNEIIDVPDHWLRSISTKEEFLELYNRAINFLNQNIN